MEAQPTRALMVRLLPGVPVRGSVRPCGVMDRSTAPAGSEAKVAARSGVGASQVVTITSAPVMAARTSVSSAHTTERLFQWK